GLHEHLARPGRSPPAVVGGAGAHHLVQGAQVILIELSRAVVLAAVEQAQLAALEEAVGDPVDGAAVDFEGVGGLCGGTAAGEVDDDEVADPEGGVAAAAQVLEEALLDREAERGEKDGHGDSLLWAGRPV